MIRRVLTTPATWAVVGLSPHATRAAYGDARWLHDGLGHRIIPVHSRAVEVWGEPGYLTLTQIPDGTAVVVDCFVNSLRVGAVVDEAIANKDRLGIGTTCLPYAHMHNYEPSLSAATTRCDDGWDYRLKWDPELEALVVSDWRCAW